LLKLSVLTFEHNLATKTSRYEIVEKTDCLLHNVIILIGSITLSGVTFHCINTAVERIIVHVIVPTLKDMQACIHT